MTYAVTVLSALRRVGVTVGLCLLGMLVVAGCGETGTSGSSPSGNITTPDMAMPYSTPFPPVFPLVDPGSAAVIAAPKMVPVFFRSDVQTNGTILTALTTAMQNYLASSNSWALMQEYGVGRGTVSNQVTLTTTPPATVTDADIQALIATSIQNGTFPKNDANTVYTLYYPSGVTITRSGLTSCTAFEGYHYYTQLSDGSKVPYIVIPRCKGATLALLTVTTSHELAETVTDPLITSYSLLKDPYGMWLFAMNGTEVADLCENLNDFLYTDPVAGVISKIYSNKTAQLGKNPCVPNGSAPSFFSVPILDTSLPLVLNGRTSNVEAVSIKAGQSRSIPVRFYSPDSPSPTWTASATEYPLPDAGGNPSPKALTLSWQESPGSQTVQGQNGAQFHLQIAVSASTTVGFTTIRLTSTSTASGMPQTMWVATVQVTK